MHEVRDAELAIYSRLYRWIDIRSCVTSLRIFAQYRAESTDWKGRSGRVPACSFKTVNLKILAQVLLKSQRPLAGLLESSQAACLLRRRLFAL